MVTVDSTNSGDQMGCSTDKTDGNSEKISRKRLLKMMKIKDARRKKRTTKRLGGKGSHSKW